MSYAVWLSWRIPCSGSRGSARGSSMLPTIFRPCRDLHITPCRQYTMSTRQLSPPNLCSQPDRPTLHQLFPQYLQSISPIQRRFKRTAPTPKSSHAVPGNKRLSNVEIQAIFGQIKVSPKLANRIVAVLHARRLQGTLDLDLPVDISRAVSQQQIDLALDWLRNNYPIDEDAAIMERIESEERAAEEKLVRRAEQLGLYKPQSGSYDAELGENNSIYGKSVLKEAREYNEKRLLAEQEQKRQKWLEGENEERDQLERQIQGNTALQQYQESALTEARPRADPIERPYLAWVQKHHIAATHNQPEALTITNSQRLLSSIVFTVITLGLCYLFAKNYEPPLKDSRLWSDIPPAAATVAAIMGINVAITLLWKYIPPSWRLLNRYFVIVPFYPSALSMIGSVFSHQTWRHLATNMFVLGLIGTKVHDEIGRGNFLAIYFASGAVGALFSLSRSVLIGALGMSSLGASGAIGGIVATGCMYHADRRITTWIIPREWQDTIWIQGWVFLACIVAAEMFAMVTPARFLTVFPLSRLTKMDHAAHLGGYITGGGCGYYLAQQRKKAEREKRASSGFARSFGF